MENHTSYNTRVLSMNISCCERCPKVLKKKLLKMPGVDSVAIDTENNLVYVAGKIDATTLVNKVAKLGKSVQLLSPEKHPGNHAHGKHGHSRNEGGGSNSAPPENRKTHQNCRCEDGRHSGQKKVEEKEEHKCEAYVPPSVDARVCRDFHCKTHPRGRTIVDRVPPESSSAFFGMGASPFYGGYSSYGGGSYQYPVGNLGQYGNGGGSYQYPVPVGNLGQYGHEPPQFGYGQPLPPRKLQHHPFIFR